MKRYNKSMQLSRIDGKSVPFVMGSSNPPAQLQASNKFQNAKSKDYNMDLEQTIRSQFENTGNQKAAMQNAISQMQPLSSKPGQVKSSVVHQPADGLYYPRSQAPQSKKLLQHSPATRQPNQQPTKESSPIKQTVTKDAVQLLSSDDL